LLAVLYAGILALMGRFR